MNWIREHKVIVGIAGAIIAIAVICCISFRGGGGSGMAGKAVNGAVTASEKGVTGVLGGIERVFRGVFNYQSVLDENKALREEVERLEKELLDEKMTGEQLRQLKQLSKALNYRAVEKGQLVSADITSFDGSRWINVFTINRGSEDGIEVDDVAVCGTGLVGRVSECGKSWAKIVSIADDGGKTSFAVLRDTDILGILSGDGAGALSGYVLDADAGIIKGDVLVTSGMGMYPLGIEIGTVTEVEYNSDTKLKMIKVEPAADFKGMMKVAVII